MGTFVPALAMVGETQESGYLSYLILLLPLLFAGWLLWSGSRRQKQMRQFNTGLNVGDQVVTSSGLFGTVKHLDDTSAYLEVADGVTLRFARQAVTMRQNDVAASGGSSTGASSAGGSSAGGSSAGGASTPTSEGQ